MGQRLVQTERDVQVATMDWLRAEHYWFERRNTAAFTAEHKGKSRMVRCSLPGTADLMVWDHRHGRVLWLEMKAGKGQQSDVQRLFQQDVERAGMCYVVARSLEDVIDALKG